MPGMLVLMFPAMAESSGQLGSWLSGLLALVYFPQSSSFVVRAISGMFVALGIALIFPTFALIAFDFVLWIWRLFSLGSNGHRLEQQQQQQQEKGLEDTGDTSEPLADGRLRQRARLAA